jgi:hypothetical protein
MKRLERSSIDRFKRESYQVRTTIVQAGISLPRDRIWTEQLFSYLPIERDCLVHQMVLRFALLLLLWFTGLVVYSFDGLMGEYVSNFQIYPAFFGPGFIILFGSYMIQNSLPDTIASFRDMIDLDDRSYRRLTEMIKRYSFSFAPCVLIALLIISSLTDVPQQILLMMAEGPKLHTLWEVSLLSFMYLLVGTGVWLGVSIWLTVLLISRQPMRVELSPRLIENFRGLSMLALWFSLFYFFSISIGVATSMTGSQASSLLEILLSPLPIFIGIGVVSVLFPFYNIHRVLLRLKWRELDDIATEYEDIRNRLDMALENQEGKETKLIPAIGQLLSLQMRERRVREAPEWPIDMGFVSRLLSLVLIPAIVRISVELFNRAFIK